MSFTFDAEAIERGLAATEGVPENVRAEVWARYGQLQRGDDIITFIHWMDDLLGPYRRIPTW